MPYTMIVAYYVVSGKRKVFPVLQCPFFPFSWWFCELSLLVASCLYSIYKRGFEVMDFIVCLLSFA